MSTSSAATPAQAPRFLDLHVVQTLPYSNVNRDDLGSPKSLTFGGVTRTRVSSQAWKRPVRMAVEETIGEKALRTRRLPEQVFRELVGRGWPEDLAALAGAQVIRSTETKLALEKGDRTTASLLFLPDSAAPALADIAEEHREALAKALGKAAAAKPLLPKDAVHEVLRSRNGSIALFGRMLAEIPGAGVDGAVQVAHAFTTHATSVQADFFTAVDDVNQWAEDAGSAHMNTGEFSTGVFYRYATLDLRDLAANVTSLTGPQAPQTTPAGTEETADRDLDTLRELATAFATAFLGTVPGAKKTSTAPHTHPDLVYVAVRPDRPLSLAAAFEEPVRAREHGWGLPSRQALSEYAARINRLLGTTELPYAAHAGLDDKSLPGLGAVADSYPALIAGAVAAAYPARGAVEAATA
ncbi:type I-E CRISPR-associated protein Cas7/Cse4/CasC [Actinacidiphila acididurans]|uniref:Type I-E CRISPR-associated protein Cas7/Cse4/CasC n=1 Tax=Actinacidiphila acididurans TaxID=2784346 RepID=A0ABS2TY27_9ACTN|nr:type I-E CRISPR-associated protein Cas7/Cse4/CasC [Actinacidiphila acididurans]MBM9507987.1 type I-E CRISPR-associated protein Cas7/Cse4/CasC [Actinacidiphila acididurans]